MLTFDIMWKKFCGFLLRAMGWTAVEPPVPEDKCIILGVPHTSMWDFVVSYLYYTSVGGKAYVMIAKEFFWWPLGAILRALGAIPVDRKSPTSLMVSLIHEVNKAKKIHLAIAPEGTRKAVRKWKTGFHTIAKECDIPVYLGYFDWKTKRVGRGNRFEITDDARADMQRIQEIYEQMHMEGKHKEGYITH